MMRLFSIIYALVSTVLMGCFIILVLVLGYDTAKPVIVAALVGLASGAPVAWMIATKLYTMK